MSGRSLGLALLLLLMAPAVAGAAPDTVVARVGGQPITEGDLAVAEAINKASAGRDGWRELPADPDDRRDTLRELLIGRRVGALAAIAAGMDKDVAAAKRLAYLREKALHDAYLDRRIQAEVTPARVRQQFETENALENREHAHLRQILLATRSDVDRAVARLRRGDAFQRVATEMSRDDVSRSAGGDIGFVRRNELPASVAAVAFGLKAGEVSPPVQSPLGWHIVQMVDTRVDPPGRFEDSRETIERTLSDDLRKQVIDRASAPAQLLRAVPGSAPRVVATIDGDPITADDVENAGSDPSVETSEPEGAARRDQLIQAVAVHKILARLARQEGLEATPGFLSWFMYGRDAYLSELLLAKEVDPTVTPAAVRGFYEREFERPQVRYRSLHLPDAATATKVLARLRRGEPMSKVANGLDPNTSYFTDGAEFASVSVLGPAFQTALARLRLGDISDPVRQGDRWLVVQLIARRDRPPLDDVEAEIRALLVRDARQEAILSLGNELGVERLS